MDSDARQSRIRQLYMNIAFPFDYNRQGLTAQVNTSDHIRNLIDQLLFTSPGERVNRPTFGSGVTQLLFAPNSDQLAATLYASTQAALQQCLGDLVEVHDLEIFNDESTLHIKLDYSIIRTDERRSDTFVRELEV
jgi:hypothetical protein